MSREFQPTDQKLDFKEVRRLMAGKIMPTAVVCLTDVNSGLVYSLTNKQNRKRGLPLIDMAGLRQDDIKSEHYLQFRLGSRFKLKTAGIITLDLLQMESNESAFMSDIGNLYYPDYHHRIYFPAVGISNTKLRAGSRLALATPDEVIDGVTAPEDGDVLQQLIDIHREILELRREF